MYGSPGYVVVGKVYVKDIFGIWEARVFQRVQIAVNQRQVFQISDVLQRSKVDVSEVTAVNYQILEMKLG